MIIRGNTVGTTMPRTNYNQTDETKPDYLVGKEVLDQKISDAKKAVPRLAAIASKPMIPVRLRRDLILLLIAVILELTLITRYLLGLFHPLLLSYY